MNHITLAVRNIERSFNFYNDVLELKPLVRWDRGAYFLTKTHPLWFCLNLDEERKATACCTHYAFSVHEEDFSRIGEKIAASGAIIYQENVSPGNSLYFLDPDGHKLEVHTGDWQARVVAKKRSLGDWKDVQWFV